MIFSDSFLIDVFGISLALLIVIISYFKWSHSYWKRRNLPYLEPTMPFSKVSNPMKHIEPIGITMKRFYEEMKRKGWQHGGAYLLTRPIYFVLDLDYVKNVLTKHFQYFEDRGFYYNEKDDPVSANLVLINGVKWRNLRTKLTPTFTLAKMKMMFQAMLACETNLQEKMIIESEKQEPIDIKDILACFSIDSIGSCAFGLECNTFTDDDSPFKKYGKRATDSSIFRHLISIFSTNFPNVARFLKIRAVPKDISDFVTKIVTQTVNYREKNNYTRNDFMQLLIELKNNEPLTDAGYKSDGKKLTIEEVCAQTFIFFLAGFETSATTMTFALYELAKNQKIQQKVREEIATVLGKHDGKITYDSIQDMKYLSQVIDETLRKYPPVPVLMRQCVQDYKIPDKNVVIEKGTTVVIPVIGIHHDEEYYPDPEKFDPERFTEENVKTRHRYSYLPFGEGPRICIGMRFGLMQSQVGLTSLLKNYSFTLNKKTKQPLQFNVKLFLLSVDGDVWLDVQKL